MASFKVSSEDMRQLSARVASGSEQTQELLGSLGSQVSSLSGQWQGSASDSFQSLFAEWQQGATQVREAMDGIARFLVSAAAGYEQTETDIAAAARS